MSVKYLPISSPDISSTREKMLTRVDVNTDDASLLDDPEKTENDTDPTNTDDQSILAQDQPDVVSQNETMSYSPNFANFSSPVSDTNRDATDKDQKNPSTDSLLKTKEGTDQDAGILNPDEDIDYIPSEVVDYFAEAAMTTKQRNQLPDSEFGIPRLRAYPLNDEKHVRLAIQMFSHCKNPKDKAGLAKRIFAKVEEFGMDVKIGKDSALYEYAPKSLQESTLIPTEASNDVQVYGLNKPLDKRTKEEIAKEHLNRNALFYDHLFYSPDYAKSLKSMEEFSFFDYFYPDFKTHNLYSRLKSSLGGLGLSKEIYQMLGMRYPLSGDFNRPIGWKVNDPKNLDIAVTVNYVDQVNWYLADTSDDQTHIFFCLRLYSILGDIMLNPNFSMDDLGPEHLKLLLDWSSLVEYHYANLQTVPKESPAYFKEAQYLHDLCWYYGDNPSADDVIASNIMTMTNMMAAGEKYVNNMNEAATTRSNRLMYNLVHLSLTNLDGTTLEPRVPDNYFAKNGYEDGTTKRVCFTPNVGKCLMAMSKKCDGMECYVMVPEGNYKTYRPTVKEVPDSKITGEIWIKEPVKVRCIGKIKVTGDAGKDGHVYTYGDGQKAELYDWNWEWTERYKFNKNVNEGTELISKEDTVGYMVHELGLEDDIFLLPATLEYPVIDKASVRLAMDNIRKVPDDEKKIFAKNLNRKYKELGCTFSISVDHPYAPYADQNIIDHMNMVLAEGDTAVQDDGTSTGPSDLELSGSPWYRRTDMTGSVGQNLLQNKELGPNDKKVADPDFTRAESLF